MKHIASFTIGLFAALGLVFPVGAAEAPRIERDSEADVRVETDVDTQDEAEFGSDREAQLEEELETERERRREAAAGETYPEPPGLEVRRAEVQRKAGLGTGMTYAEAGVVTLGGSASFSTGEGFTSISLRPEFGYFIADNIQLGAILGYRFLDPENNDTAADATHFFDLMFEPSLHLPVTNAIFGFAGLGLGPVLDNDNKFGIGVTPRIGANFLIGRSGIFTPALFGRWSSTDTIQTDEGSLIVGDFAWGLSAGYTVMW